MVPTIVFPNEELEMFPLSNDILLRHKKTCNQKYLSQIFANFSKERFQDPCFHKFFSFNDDLFLYCECLELETDSYGNISANGVKYVYCYDFLTNFSYFKNDENVSCYIQSLKPFRNEENISYLAKEYFPAGSWERIYSLN
jgi:hypothetical protein